MAGSVGYLLGPGAVGTPGGDTSLAPVPLYCV